MWIGLIWLTQDRAKWQDLLTIAMNLRDPWNAGNFLISWLTVILTRTLLHGCTVVVIVMCMKRKIANFNLMLVTQLYEMRDPVKLPWLFFSMHSVTESYVQTKFACYSWEWYEDARITQNEILFVHYSQNERSRRTNRTSLLHLQNLTVNEVTVFAFIRQK
jgi:hypothetical protein